MIESRFRTFGYWLTLISVVGGVLFTVYLFWSGFYRMHVLGVLFTLFSITVLFGTFGRLLYDSNLIQIDTTKQTITFKNQLTRKRSSFQFSDFDGKLLCFEPIKGGYVRNLYLVINKRAVRKFTDFIYSNQSEIESALSSIKDLGTFNYSYLKTWRISLGLPILK
jgi:hypothetical protein